MNLFKGIYEQPKQEERKVVDYSNIQGVFSFGDMTQIPFLKSATADDSLSRYSNQPELRSVIDQIVKACLDYPIKVRRISTNKEIENNELGLLMQRCNPSQSYYEFWTAVYTFLLLDGEVFLLKQRNIPGTRIPSSLYIISSGTVDEIVETQDRYGNSILKEYMIKTKTYGTQSERIAVQPSEMLHIKLFTGTGNRGISPVKTILADVDGGIALREMDKNAMNRALSNINIFTPPAVNSGQDLSDLRDNLGKLGGYKRSNSLVVTNLSLEKHEINTMPPESIWKEMRKMIASTIAMLYGFPVELLSTTYMPAKYENYNETRKRLYTECAKPKVDLLCSYLNKFLTNEYSGNIELYADETGIGVLQEDTLLMAQEMKILVEAGMKPEYAYKMAYGEEPEGDMFKDEEEPNSNNQGDNDDDTQPTENNPN